MPLLPWIFFHVGKYRFHNDFYTGNRDYIINIYNIINKKSLIKGVPRPNRLRSSGPHGGPHGLLKALRSSGSSHRDARPGGWLGLWSIPYVRHACLNDVLAFYPCGLGEVALSRGLAFLVCWRLGLEAGGRDRVGSLSGSLHVSSAHSLQRDGEGIEMGRGGFKEKRRLQAEQGLPMRLGGIQTRGISHLADGQTQALWAPSHVVWVEAQLLWFWAPACVHPVTWTFSFFSPKNSLASHGAFPGFTEQPRSVAWDHLAFVTDQLVCRKTPNVCVHFNCLSITSCCSSQGNSAF